MADAALFFCNRAERMVVSLRRSEIDRCEEKGAEARSRPRKVAAGRKKLRSGFCPNDSAPHCNWSYCSECLNGGIERLKSFLEANRIGFFLLVGFRTEFPVCSILDS